ncbi:hypothetical protein HZU75_09155 [Chitinibacter fontanus]|uniref:Uncharacterized protein n=1 Tax=Chitinibacter fontanus TaxID=1737446 RepID=A0A7D5ZEN1_9NEIS|nr:DUF6714 family protein [Chitinibacter fontanus]QLI81684.1 hypothetical protein HZU75_09155 [Chitinibacter fontanus]
MNNATELCHKIREQFSSAPFPRHCGLHAAMAMDDWITDEKTLKEITEREDYAGSWWDVPRGHLHNCMMALSYLDAAGINFYLPAYMTAIIEKPSDFDKPREYASSWQILFTMLPEDNDPELSDYFQERFSEIRGERKDVCREFLCYVKDCELYDEHARSIANKALASNFWIASN